MKCQNRICTMMSTKQAFFLGMSVGSALIGIIYNVMVLISRV